MNLLIKKTKQLTPLEEAHSALIKFRRVLQEKDNTINAMSKRITSQDISIKNLRVQVSHLKGADNELSSK